MLQARQKPVRNLFGMHKKIIHFQMRGKICSNVNENIKNFERLAFHPKKKKICEFLRIFFTKFREFSKSGNTEIDNSRI